MERIEGNLLFGLGWESATYDEDTAIRSLTLQGQTVRHHVKHEYQNRITVGYTAEKAEAHDIAGAAAFAELAGTAHAILLIELDESDDLALVHVANHSPIDDLVQDRESIYRELQRIIEAGKAAQRNYQFFGNISVDKLAEFGIREVQEIKLDELTELKQYQLKAVAKRINKLVVATIALVLGIGTIVALEMSQDKPVIQTEDPTKLHKAQVDGQLKAIKDQKAFPRQIIPAFKEFADGVPFRLPGWKLGSLDCSPKSCTATYQRLDGGSTKVFLQLLAERALSFSQTDLDHISIPLNYEVQLDAEPLEVPNYSDLNKQLASWLQFLKDRKFFANLSNPPHVLVPPPPEAKPKKEDLIRAGDFAFSVTYADIQRLSDIPNYISISSLTIRPTDDKPIEVEVKGRYYVY